MTLRQSLEVKEKQAIEKKKEKHYCSKCLWGIWYGTKHYCMFPTCIEKSSSKGGERSRKFSKFK